MKIIADLTKCYPNTHEDILAQVVQFSAARQQVAPGDLQIMARGDQTFSGHDGMNVQTVSDDRVQSLLAIKAAVSNACASNGAGNILLLSYDTGVLRLAGEPHGGTQVIPMPLSKVRMGVPANRGIPHTRVPRRTRAWFFSQVIPLEDALKVLASVLRTRGSYSIETHTKQTELRPALAGVDSRFMGNGLQTGTTGMISTLVAIAEERQIIRTDRTTLAKNALIWLISPPASADVPEPAVATATVVAPSPTPPAESNADADSPYRSRRLEALLRPENLGPYRDARMATYDAIEMIVKSGSEKLPTVDQLIDAGTVKASEVLKGQGKDTAEKKQPWARVKPFIHRLLTCAAVLLDENGHPIKSGWMSHVQKVKGLADDWRMKADAEIVLAVIAADNITEDDVLSLAGLLYHKHDLESRAAAARAVGYLLETGKAVVGDDTKQTLRVVTSVKRPETGNAES